jgi:hypothetical protein
MTDIAIPDPINLANIPDFDASRDDQTSSQLAKLRVNHAKLQRDLRQFAYRYIDYYPMEQLAPISQLPQEQSCACECGTDGAEECLEVAAEPEHVIWFVLMIAARMSNASDALSVQLSYCMNLTVIALS